MTSEMFLGALFELYDTKVLVARVGAAVLRDPYEMQLVIDAFQQRCRRIVVLCAQEGFGAPSFYGPEGLVRVLCAIPFDALTWRPIRYRATPPPMLPIPIELSDLPSCDTDQTVRLRRV
jgi:hypothetical protein